MKKLRFVKKIMNDNEKNLEIHVEALLFLKGEPMSIKYLAKILEVKERAVEEALETLEKNLINRGIKLIKKEDSVALATSPESAEFAKKLVSEEFDSELSKPGLEILSIIIYKGPVSRADINYIRGVESTFSIRNLLVRGLIERIPNPKDSRSFLYKPSFDLLRHLGIGKIEDMPEYGEFNKKMDEFIKIGAETDKVNT